MRAGERGKIGLGAIIVCAAVGYVAWRWGVPWVDQMARDEREVPPQNADADGVPDAPQAPKPAPAPAPTGTREPAAPKPEPPTPPAPDPSPSAPAAADPREAEALKLLNKARNWEANRRPETAIAMYEELIEVYAGTQAAEEARPLLKALKAR